MTEAFDDATRLAALVAAKEVSPVELVEAACRRIEQVDPQLGAVPVRFFEEAIERAGRARPGPAFAGIPFLMKDVGARQKGQPYYAGNQALRDADHRAAEETPLGARFRAVGLVTVGNSSTPEFGLQSNTWPVAYGPTRNPWDRERAAGGSSGGACAAVAAGLVPVAHASDGAGSIRIPAAWCGLVGLKPTRDRIVWRHAGENRSDVEFIVARSLRDTAAFLDHLSVDARAGGGPASVSAVLGLDPPPLRIGIWCDAPEGVALDPDCYEAVQAVARRLAEQGHHVAEQAPASLAQSFERAVHGGVLGITSYSECIDDLEERLGRSVSEADVEPFLWELSRLSVDVTPAQCEEALRWYQGWVERTLRWFEEFDLLLTPSVFEPAPLLRELDPTRLTPYELLDRMAPHMAFTEPWNATGQPAITLPLAWTAEGLPVGVQLVADRGREELLFRVAATLMEPAPTPDTPRPPIHA